MMGRSILLFFVLVFATQSASQTLFGHANTSCIELLENHKVDGINTSVLNWIEGYFSGRIRETAREMQIVNELNIPIYDLLHKTCAKNPNLNLHQAADIVYVSIP